MDKYNSSSNKSGNSSSKDEKKKFEESKTLEGSTDYTGKVEAGKYGAVGDGRPKKY